MSRPGARVFSREFKEAAVGRILAGEKVKALAIEPGGVAEAVVRLVGRPGCAYRAAVGAGSTLGGRRRACLAPSVNLSGPEGARGWAASLRMALI